MKPIKLLFVAFLALLSLLWLLADTLAPEPFNYFAFRGVFVQFSGVLAIGVMSLALLLAVRPVWLEGRLNGLDKMYRLHKWLGIAALVFGALHWWMAKGTKWMVGWGWLERPARRPPGAETLTTLEQWLRDQRGLAESLGEWAFYAAAVLIALALIKAFPYRLFRQTHKLLAIGYLVLAYHSFILTKQDYWSQPIGWLVALLLVVGVGAALLVLLGRVGHTRKVQGRLESLTHYPGVKVLEGTIALEPGWSGHKPGQFAFVTSSASEGPHPYTIASAWDPQARRLTFIVKQLGDWTARLGEHLQEGMPVSVEGPYGCFDFDDAKPRQIWVGGGIGITPFIARMQHLARNPGPQVVDLFHVTGEFDQAAIDKLHADAEAAHVTLHLRVTPKDGRLTPAQMREAVPEWARASIWFCGPAGFGQALRADFTAHGLAAADFHQELFEMR